MLVVQDESRGDLAKAKHVASGAVPSGRTYFSVAV